MWVNVVRSFQFSAFHFQLFPITLLSVSFLEKDNGTKNRGALGSSARSSAGDYRDVGSGAGPAWRVTGPTSWYVMGIVVILTIHPVSAKLPVMPSLRQTSKTRRKRGTGK
jgi:hypothetical protein